MSRRTAHLSHLGSAGTAMLLLSILGSPGCADQEDPDPLWYRKAVFYELWVRSFQDSDGDGVGDLQGLTQRLDYLRDLGIGAIWLMPIHPSPLADSGYDVADHYGIHPDYGDLEIFRAFLNQAHQRGLRVFMDLVLNHTSTEHHWFQESRVPGGEKADWYIWASQPGKDCEQGPLGFGAERWTYDDLRGEYYFHQFGVAQPELNFANPVVQDELLNVVRYWLDMGVDGFRLDVAHRYYDDLPGCQHQEGTFAFHRRLRQVADEYPARALIGEVAGGAEQVARYLQDGANGLHMVFFLEVMKDVYVAARSGYARALNDAIAQIAGLSRRPGTHANTLGNHDVPRVSFWVEGALPALKLAAAAQMAFPGVPFVYYGEELGMSNGAEIVVDFRDMARTPMQWDDSATAGFTTGAPFLPLAKHHREANVAAQDGKPDSMLSFYRSLIALRNRTPALQDGEFEAVEQDTDSLIVFWRRHGDGDRLVILHYDPASSTDVAITLPPAWRDAAGLRDTITGEPAGSIDDDGVWTATLPPRGFMILAR